MRFPGRRPDICAQFDERTRRSGNGGAHSATNNSASNSTGGNRYPGSQRHHCGYDGSDYGVRSNSNHGVEHFVKHLASQWISSGLPDRCQPIASQLHAE